MPYHESEPRTLRRRIDITFAAAVFPDVSCADGEYSFRVDFDYYASRCWFNMRDSDQENPSFEGLNSPGFELSRTAADATFGPGQPTASITTSSIPSSTEPPESSSTADTNASESTAANPSSSPNGDSGSSLSTGAKAGIGVGVALGVLGIAALIGAFWMLRRKKASGGPPSLHGDDAPPGRQELHAELGGYKQPEHQMQEYYEADGVKHEKQQEPPSELTGSTAQYEVEGTRRMHELQG